MDTDARIEVPTTFGSGALYHWWEEDGWYETTVNGGFVRVRDDGEGFAYESDESEGVDEETVAGFLGLRDDLNAVYASLPDDGYVAEAVEACRGTRIPRDGFFASVVSFIASARSRNGRTRSVVRRLCERHGETREGWRAHAFPSPERVASLSEEALRDVGFGYRAPYVRETARSIADGEVVGDEVRRTPYREARTELKRLRGVGDKVADCVLLFSLGFVGVVALDTWLRRIIDEHYPELARGGYDETARAFRDRFGEYAGYAQTYMYHHARTDGL